MTNHGGLRPLPLSFGLDDNGSNHQGDSAPYPPPPWLPLAANNTTGGTPPSLSLASPSSNRGVRPPLIHLRQQNSARRRGIHPPPSPCGRTAHYRRATSLLFSLVGTHCSGREWAQPLPFSPLIGTQQQRKSGSHPFCSADCSDTMEGESIPPPSFFGTAWGRALTPPSSSSLRVQQLEWGIAPSFLFFEFHRRPTTQQRGDVFPLPPSPLLHSTHQGGIFFPPPLLASNTMTTNRG